MIEIQKSVGLKIGIVSGIIIVILLSIYLGISFYFVDHFYFGTLINEIEVGGKTIGEAELLLSKEVENYVLELKERADRIEEIRGSDIGLYYDLGNQIAEIKEKQPGFKWPWRIRQTKQFQVSRKVEYNDSFLKEVIKKLDCLKKSFTKEPEDATVQFVKEEYVVVEGDKGSKVNEETLYNRVKEAILAQEESLDLDKAGCYEEAQQTVDSKELIQLRDLLNNYIKTEITYVFGDREEIVDYHLIQRWLSYNESLQVNLDEEAVKMYIQSLANTYNTLGTTRSFMTSAGVSVQVPGGDYGWRMNEEEEIIYLIEAIKQGKIESREPAYIQKGFCRDTNDIGDTYVEINLTQQYLWFYKEGKLMTEGSVVTGTANTRYATPDGVYKLDYKKKDTILRGPGYATPVSFWMPFNLDIGIHDAVWRGSFGGTIYQTSGSHGCVNTPYEVAQESLRT